MKRLIAGTALAVVLAAPAYTAGAQEMMTVERLEQGDIYASEFIGMRIYATEDDVSGNAYEPGQEAEWDDIGEVDDLILTEDGSVKAVVLGIGGFLGIGERDIAVDMSSIKRVRESDDRDDFFLVVNANREMLENAPQYERTRVPTEAEMADARDEMSADTEAKDADADMAAKDDMDTETAAANDPATKTDMRFVPPTVDREGYRAAERQDLTADMLQGARVYGSNDEDVGEIDRLLITEDGQITEVVIDVGGFLGIGEHPIAVSLDELQILREDDGYGLQVFIDATEEQLEQRPAYEG